MFLAILGHDLRNPLNCIRMATHLVKKEHPNSVEVISLIETSTEASIRLVNDLIDFSLGAMGGAMHLERRPVNLNQLCQEVIAGYRASHPGRTLRFHSDGEVTGVWDAARIRQVVSNLLDNALQHGSPTGPIDLSLAVEGSTPDKSTVVMRVHNEGKPIPPEILPTIFNPLVRYASRESTAKRSTGSIGLGLYIVREIVAAKGGTVEITSTAEEGTTFTVRIPRFLTVESDNPADAIAAR
jgi:signal transduction histidine kinase